MVVEDTPVLLTNYVVDKIVWDELQTAIMNNFPKEQRPSKLIIFAPDFKSAVLEIMARQNLKNKSHIFNPVKVPSLKTVQFEDVEVVTGAKFFNKDKGDRLIRLTERDLGSPYWGRERVL